MAQILDNIIVSLSPKQDVVNFNPPVGKASKEVANLTERKNPDTPVNGVKEFVCPSVRPSVRPSVTNFDPNYLRIGKTERAETFLGHLWQKATSQIFLFVR